MYIISSNILKVSKLLI